MIDYCAAECNVIQAVIGDVNIRLCQFHIIKAISSFEIDLSDTKETSDSLNSKEAKISNKASIKVRKYLQPKLEESKKY